MVLRPFEALLVQRARLQAGIDVAIEGDRRLEPVFEAGVEMLESWFSRARLSEMPISRLRSRGRSFVVTRASSAMSSFSCGVVSGSGRGAASKFSDLAGEITINMVSL